MKPPYILDRRTVGVNVQAQHTAIRLWAPEATAATLHNESRGLTLVLERQEHGYWALHTKDLGPGDRYYFYLNEGEKLPDPASLAQPDGVHGHSEVTALDDYTWSDHDWRNPDFGHYIIYELHTGAFSEEGTFAGIAQKLDHLKELGINAIELMPVAQFPGSRNWGYDGVYPFAVQHSYGGARGLQQLVDLCHRKGFAVILDVVYNHLGPEGNYFPAYGPYFTDKYKTPWGSAVNFDDAWCDPVRAFFIENALMWLRDFHIDALRLDAVHAIKDYSPVPFIRELNDAVAALNETLGSPKYLIAETDLNDSRYVRGTEAQGYGLRAQWCDEFHHALRVAAGQERTGYYADFKGLPDLATALKNAYVYTGQYSEERHRYFGTPTEGISGDHFVIFAQNHDQVGNRMLGERAGQLYTFEMQKLLAAVTLTAPFVPLLFMGEEWGATTPFRYFTDHSDESLILAVEEGRKKEFAHFQQQGGPAPANEPATFEDSRLDWAQQAEGKHRVMLDYYQALIALRKATPALLCYERDTVSVIADAEKEVLVLERSYKEQHVFCLYNFSDSKREIRLRPEVFPLRVLLSSSDSRWQGPEDSYLAYDHDILLTLHPQSVILLANYHVPS